MHWIIERHPVVSSTMDAADERARRGAPSGVVIVAGEQTKGRGQRGRRWLAPAGSSLLMTIIARPEIKPDQLTDLPAVIGAHVKRAIEQMTGVPCQLKHPNDVLINGRKLAGILGQSSVEGERVNYVLIGIGINVNIPEDQLPFPTATSIEVETGHPWDVNQLLDCILDEMEHCWLFSNAVHAGVGCGG